MRITTNVLLLPVLGMALGACGYGDERTEELAESIEAEAPAVDATQGMAIDTLAVEGEPEGAQAAVALQPVGGSNVSGEATVRPTGANQTSVQVTLNAPADAGGVYQGHIHQGSCDAIGSVVAPLQPVTVAGGTGTMTATVQLDPTTALDGNHLIVYHQVGGNPGRPTVCGAIPGQV